MDKEKCKYCGELIAECDCDSPYWQDDEPETDLDEVENEPDEED